VTEAALESELALPAPNEGAVEALTAFGVAPMAVDPSPRPVATAATAAGVERALEEKFVGTDDELATPVPASLVASVTASLLGSKEFLSPPDFAASAVKWFVVAAPAIFAPALPGVVEIIGAASVSSDSGDVTASLLRSGVR
jgi:hypothetical protein